jgi:hypothetical protein
MALEEAGLPGWSWPAAPPEDLFVQIVRRQEG